MNTEQYFLKGRYKLSTIPHEMKMSHWIYAPVLVDTENNEILVNLEGSIWDLRSAIESRNSIVFKLARYPDGTKEHVLELSPCTETVILNSASHPITKVVEALNKIV